MKNQKLHWFDWIVVAAIVCLAAWIFIGFYYPDPYVSHRFGKGFLRLLVLAGRVVTIGFFSGIIVLFFTVRIGRLSGANALLVVVSVLIASLLFYPIGRHLYFKKANIASSLDSYHPYLQLKPPLPDSSSLLPDRCTIFCLGGSTTEFGDKEGHGWVARLEKALRDRMGDTDIVVCNLGRQWYTTLHTLINYETNLRMFKPDVIIVMHAINDLLQNADESYFSHGRYQEDYGHFYGPINRIITQPGFIHEVSENMRIWYHRPRETLEANDFPGLKAYERNLNTLIDLARTDGTVVILITQPTLLKEKMTREERDVLHMVNVETYGPRKKWSCQSAFRGMEAYNNKTREIAEARGVFLIDLEKVIPKTLDCFWDDVHYCDTTYSLIAEYVSERILQQKILEKRQETN